MYELGQRLKEARLQRGLTQAVVGKRINKCKSAICNYETGVQVPPLDVLISLAAVLNVSLDYIAGLDSRKMLSTNGLTQEQTEVIQMILQEFTEPTNISSDLSPQQIVIVQKLILQFNKRAVTVKKK